MESFWAPVRRAYNGTFHRIDPKRLHRYVNEFAGRPSMRAQDTMSKMRSTVQSMVGKRLTYALLVDPSTLCGRP